MILNLKNIFVYALPVELINIFVVLRDDAHSICYFIIYDRIQKYEGGSSWNVNRFKCECVKFNNLRACSFKNKEKINLQNQLTGRLQRNAST